MNSSGCFLSLLTFFLAVSIGLMVLVAPMTMIFRGGTWQMIAALVGALVFFAFPFQAFRTGKFSPPLTILGFLCLGLTLQGWAYVATTAREDDALRSLGREVGGAMLSGGGRSR